jgi:hypothetical protein
VWSQPSASIALAVVALHHVVAAHHHLAGLAAGQLLAGGVDAAHLEVRNRAARGGGDGLRVVVIATHADDTGGLREAIAGDDRLEAELVAHALDELHRDRRRAGDGQPQRREVVPVELRVGENRLVERRRARKHRDAVAADPLEHGGHVEDLLGEDRGAAHDRREPARLVAEGVEEGVHDQVSVALPQPHHFAPAGEGPQVLAVRGHHPLGAAGGAGGEEKI